MNPGSEMPVPRRARIYVGALLLVLTVPGLLGLELWPITGWKLFSVSRTETASRWVIEGVYEDGASRIIDFGELPVAYSNSEWPLRSVGAGGTQRSREICQVLLAAAHERDPHVVEVRIARDSQRLVPDGDEWAIAHDLDVRETCVVAGP